MNNYITITARLNGSEVEAMKIVAENWQEAFYKLYKYNSDYESELFRKSINNLSFEEANKLYNKFSMYTLIYFAKELDTVLYSEIHII